MKEIEELAMNIIVLEYAVLGIVLLVSETKITFIGIKKGSKVNLFDKEFQWSTIKFL
jgi:hypothetical protein